MLTRVVFRATLVAMLAAAVAMPAIGLAEESGSGQPRVSQEGHTPRGEHVRGTQDGDRGHDVKRAEVRRCMEAVKEHGGDRDDLRRCLAEAHGKDVTRPEVRRCVEAVKERGGDRDDLRRCLAHAHDDDAPRPTAVGPSSLLERVPEPVNGPGTD